MHQRTLLKIDPYFTELFFAGSEEGKDNASFIPIVDFPLPKSSEHYPEFYASVDGVQFRLGVIAILKEIVSYLDNKMAAYKEQVESFLLKYINYAGGDAGVNINNFIIYSQGVPFLKGIATLLKELNVSADKKSDLVEELLKHFGVCGPGVGRHIADTYLKLKAMQNIRDEFSLFRLEAAQQVVNMGLKTLDREYIGSDIHYVNAITNHYADVLGFRQLDDEYIKSCNEHILGYLYSYFNGYIRKALSLDSLLNKIIAALDLQNWITRLQKSYSENNMPVYNNTMASLEEKLAIYGQAILSVDSLLLIDDDFNIRGLQYDAIDKLKLNLINRFSESGYLIIFDWKTRQFSETLTLHYLLQQPINFFHVTFHGEVYPFTTFFRKAILHDWTEMTPLHEFLTLFVGYSLQFMEDLAKYTNSFEFANTKHIPEELDRLLNYLVLEGKECWFMLLNHMPEKIGIRFIKKLLTPYVDDAVIIEVVRIYYLYPLFEKRALIINGLLGNHDIKLTVDNTNHTLLHYASTLNLPLTAHYFIDKQADIEARDTSGKTPLFYAASANSSDVLGILLTNNADVDVTDNEGTTALMQACDKGNVEAVTTLLQYKARVDLVDNDNINALQFACGKGSLKIVNLLIDNHVDVNAFDVNVLEDSPLSLAVIGNHKDIVLALFNAGVVFNLRKKHIPKLFAMLDVEKDAVVIIKALNDLLDAYLKEMAAKQEIINLRLFNEEQMLGFLASVHDESQDSHAQDLKMRRCAKYAVAKAILNSLDLESSCSLVADSTTYESLLWKLSSQNSNRMTLFTETYFQLASKGLVKKDYFNIR